MTDQQRKKLITALKIGVSALLIYFIFTKISLRDIADVIQKSNPLFLLLAMLPFIFSKVLAAFRLNAYFHQIGVKITQQSNLKLYLLGMFYNLFLPGGIGGDAYKGYAIQKAFKPGTKKVVSVLLLDRLSGMLFIFIYGCIFTVWVNIPFLLGFKWLVILCIPLGIMGFWLVNKKMFPYVLPVFWKSLGYSALVQLLQLISVLCILRALSITWNVLEYLLVFLVSSIVSVIPLTIGGIGSREVTFLYGSKWLGLDSGASVGVSFVFFFITALVSLLGIIYHFKKPKLLLSA